MLSVKPLLDLALLVVTLASIPSMSWAVDCNSNGVADAIEIAGKMEDESSVLTLAAPGTVSHTIPDAPPAAGLVSFMLYGADAPEGSICIDVNGTNVASNSFPYVGCAAQSAEVLVLPMIYNAQLTGGDATIEITIAGTACSGTSGIALITSYAVAQLPDCTTSGIPDECEIAAGTSDDCDSNGVPDDCDPDCNCNGHVDGCDILAGTALDCNTNNVPDECEPLCVADMDADEDLDEDDLAPWPGCLDGPTSSPPAGYLKPCCELLDLDLDGDVDLADFADFERLRSAGSPPCACPDQDCALPSIYVGIVMHNEEPGADPDYFADSNAFHFARGMVVDFADMLYAEDVKFNYQSDWNFLEAMRAYDNGADTGGKNLLRYLREGLGFEVDPHAHETLYNYADVAFLDKDLLGGPPSGVVGGMIYYPPEESKLEYLWSPIMGSRFPGFTWQAEILWGAGTFLHEGNDERAAGVWRPKSTCEFFTDDPTRLPYVGGFTKNADGVLTLLEQAEQDELQADRIYATTMNYTQRTFTDAADIAAVRDDIQAIQQQDRRCLVKWRTLQEIVSDWQSLYSSVPNIHLAPDFEPNPCRATLRLDSAAAPVGGIAVRVFAPYPGDERYPEGAPVAVFVKGGHDAQIVSADDDTHVQAAVEHGYIHVSFTMPGGQNSEPSESSGGVFDYRGPACKQALADVLKFALGSKTDTNGLSITDHIPSALIDNVGVVGRSNGGNLALTTLVDYSADLGDVAWIAFFESPIGDQMVASELGSTSGGLKNPFYVLGTTTVTTSPWPGLDTVLAFDSSVAYSLIDPASGLTTVVNGIFFADVNTNGVYDTTAPVEFAFDPLPGPGVMVGDPPKAYTSVELRSIIAAKAATLFPSGAPAWLASPAEVTGYWAERDGSQVLDDLALVHSDLRMISLGTDIDHGVIAQDHPHISALVNGWLGAGGQYIRLNPDAVYLSYVSGVHPILLPDNDANQPMVFATVAATRAMMIPEKIFGAPILETDILSAAILEMADRTRGTDWTDNLSEVLY